ncbi:hypothetical protein JD969_20035 [Planctomycetota bacterium]|nr:hypothetical protein JD969_20035 [Planctomycetota bacterium]
MSEDTQDQSNTNISVGYDLAGDTSHLFQSKSIDSPSNLVGKVVNSTKRAKFCLDCGYDLRGILTRRCPECGKYFNPNDFNTYAVTPRDAKETKWVLQRPWFLPLLVIGVPTLLYFMLLSAILSIDPNKNAFYPTLEVIFYIAMIISPLWHIAVFIVVMRCIAIRYNFQTRFLIMIATGSLLSSVIYVTSGFSGYSAILALITIVAYAVATIIAEGYSSLWE